MMCSSSQDPLVANRIKNGKANRVSFGDVSVREFEVIPSDNPSVSSGAGIQVSIICNTKE